MGRLRKRRGLCWCWWEDIVFARWISSGLDTEFWKGKYMGVFKMEIQ